MMNRLTANPCKCIGTVSVCRSDFEDFKALLGAKLIKLGFSWNEDGEMWVSLTRKQKQAGLQRDVLNKQFKVVAEIMDGLNRIRHAPGSLWPLNQKNKPATWGFYVQDDRICRKGKERTCLARLEMA